jgi:uncharacterized protein
MSCLTVAALRLPLAGLALSALVTAAAAQTAPQPLPPGFHSFVPRANDTFIRKMSREAEADLDAGVAAYMAKDYAAAQTLLARPAEEGSAQANWMLAHMYRKGLGGPVDELRAHDIYQRMADNFDPDEPDRNIRFFMVDGLSRLADILRTGNKAAGTKRDRRRALRLYQMAASAGHADAQYGLGMMYLTGEGVAKDRAYGMRWLGTAAQKRHAAAAAMLADVYYEKSDPIRALVWYRIAADTANTELSPRVLNQHEHLSRTMTQPELAEADEMYRRWSNRFPIQHRTAN